MKQQERKGHQTGSIAALIVGLMVIGANVFAALTPFLSGPIFHPAWILIGITCCFLALLVRTGAWRDPVWNA